MAEWVSNAASPDSGFQEAMGSIDRLNGPVTDLEGVLTNLCLGEGPFASLSPSNRANLARSIRCCIQAWFEAICLRHSPARQYAALANLLTKGDAVLTFNYDVALEAELVRAGKFKVKDGYVGIEASWNEDPSDVRVAKLHGSINWTGEIRGPRPGSISAGRIVLRGPFVDNRSSVLPVYPAEVLDTTCSGRGGMIDRSVHHDTANTPEGV